MREKRPFGEAFIPFVFIISYEPCLRYIANLANVDLRSARGIAMAGGLAAVISAIVFLVQQNIHKLYALRPLRRRLPLHELEGFWYEQVRGIPARPYSIGHIRYDAEQHRWIYAGTAFGVDFKPCAEWIASSFHFNPANRKWFLMGDAWLLEEKGAGHYAKADEEGEVLTVIDITRSSGAVWNGFCRDYGGTANRAPGQPLEKQRYFEITLFRITAGDFHAANPTGYGARHKPEPRRLDDLNHTERSNLACHMAKQLEPRNGSAVD